MSDQPASVQPSAPSGSSDATWKWVVGGLGVGSVAIGIFLYSQYARSERVLMRDLDTIRDQGRALTPEGCIDAVLGWWKGCEAMSGLCDMSVPRMMMTCLQAADRSAYCSAHPSDTTAATFGKQQCKDKGFTSTKQQRATCAFCYRSVDYHCKELGKRAAVATASTEARP